MGEIIPTKATNGKTFNDNTRKAASSAVDKDLETDATLEATTDEEAWMKLEFDREYLIDRVIVYNRFYNNWFRNTVNCVQSLENYKGCVDHLKDVEVSVYQGDVKQKSCGTLRPNYGLEQTDQIYTLICNAKGDAVKLSKNSGRFPVWEVVVTKSGTAQPK